MNVRVEPGKYVVAVSGGVDSMVLLDLLAGQPGLELTVAHFDHGMRPDSRADREVVQKAAERYGLPFVYDQGRLAPGASEARAREARYAFLYRVREERGADAIITAHHQDDVLETAILNMLRGTGRKGLSSLGNREGVVRPLLDWRKQDVRAYARQHDIAWREDATNTDERYLRNYIRHNILTRFSETDRRALLARIGGMRQINDQLDEVLGQDIQEHGGSRQLERTWFIGLPYAISCEVMAAWLRQNGIRGFTRGQIERLVVAVKTRAPGKRLDVDANYILHVGKEAVILQAR